MIRPSPCFNCGSRASCRHREVEDVELPSYEREVDRRNTASQGWGKKGNPAGKVRQRMLEQLKAQAFK